MGILWLEHPVLWHSSRVPSGYNYDTMTAEQILLLRTRWHDWYTADWDYGHTSVAFLCAVIGCSILLNTYARLRARSAVTGKGESPGLLDKLTALVRFTGARQFHVRATNYYAPPLAAIIAVCGMWIFFMALLLAARPFYWPNDAMGHSPPIATRAGWISIAIMPFMIAFATKVNLIAIVTSTSHEKLQVFHRWSATIMYITSLVHTFPFIVIDIRTGTMRSSWNPHSSPFYWTGVVALVPQTILIVFSWGIFRNRYYEIFKQMHFLLSSLFMAALFIHVNFTLSSWDYFWATLAIYGLAWLIRVTRIVFFSGFGLPATVTRVGPDLLKISITVTAARFGWSPGQHIFVRIFGLREHTIFSSHPFTISSVHGASGGPITTADLVLRVHDGMTRALAARVSDKTPWTTRVAIDGPYGGLHVPLQAYERVYLLAGGSGATVILPIFADLAAKVKAGGMTCQRIELVVSMPDSDMYTWMEPIISAAAADLPETAFGLRVHHTREGESKDSEIALDVLRGRPVLSDIVREAHSSASKVAVVACGPDGFLYDVRNAVAEAQLVIADGFDVCKDLFLHTETYSW